MGSPGNPGRVIPGPQGPTGPTGPCDPSTWPAQPPCNHDHAGDTLSPVHVKAVTTLTQVLDTTILRAGSLIVAGRSAGPTLVETCGDTKTLLGY
jgi:hypothetical protein